MRSPEALGALPTSLIKLVLRDSRLGEVPFALLTGLPALQARSLDVILDNRLYCTSCGKMGNGYLCLNKVEDTQQCRDSSTTYVGEEFSRKEWADWSSTEDGGS